MCNQTNYVAPCGATLMVCNATAYHDQRSCAYSCGQSTGCRCGVGDCANCANNDD